MLKKVNSVGVLLLCLAIVSLTFSSCELKPCEGYPCVNGTPQPDAEDCYCICNSGWGGSDCTIENVCVTRNVNCENGGVCNNGICICNNGFEGDSCELYVRDKFVGSYTAIDFCSISGVLQYTMTIYPNSVLLSASLSNQLANSKFNDSLLTTVNGNTIKIIEDEVDGSSFEIRGLGTISNDTLTLTYIMANLSNQQEDTCRGIWIKQ